MLKLKFLDYELAVCKLPFDSEIPAWALNSKEFFSITRTTDELSIVCLCTYVPNNIQVERGWMVFKVMGTLEFSLTGILSSIALPLAQNNISIFAISTFDTDYVLIKYENLQKTKKILSSTFEIE